MYLNSSSIFNKCLKIFCYLYSFILNSQEALGNENLTDSTTTEEFPVQSATTEISISKTTSSNNNNSSRIITTPNPTLIRNNAPSINIPLAGENLKLNVTASENNLEFTVIVNNTTQHQSSEISLQISKAKRLLIGFDSEKHFNVDVVELSLSNDTDGKVTFGNRVQDLSWNKLNGVLLPDAMQSYKWVASGAEKNGSIFFVTFVRSWLTCDKQDIQFLLSPIKIWWLVDNDENTNIIKGKTKASNTMDKMFEKQVEGPPVTATEISLESYGEVTTLKDNSASTEIPYLLSTLKNDMKSSTMTTIATLTTITNSKMDNKSKSTNTTRDSKPEEIEILKSIEQDNFKGPVNMSLNIFLKNVSWVILKRCEAPNVIFRCNESEYNVLSSLNSSLILPFIWNVVLLDKNTSKLSENFPEHQLESCRSALNVGNTKLFNALSSNRNSNGRSQSKNSGSDFHNVLKIGILWKGAILTILKIMMTF